jgi:hypothetical protein
MQLNEVRNEGVMSWSFINKSDIDETMYNARWEEWSVTHLLKVSSQFHRQTRDFGKERKIINKQRFVSQFLQVYHRIFFLHWDDAELDPVSTNSNKKKRILSSLIHNTNNFRHIRKEASLQTRSTNSNCCKHLFFYNFLSLHILTS